MLNFFLFHLIKYEAHEESSMETFNASFEEENSENGLYWILMHDIYMSLEPIKQSIYQR